MAQFLRVQYGVRGDLVATVTVSRSVWWFCLQGVGGKQRTQAGTDAGLSFKCFGVLLWLLACFWTNRSHIFEGSTVFQNTCWGQDVLDPIHNK